MGIILWIIFGAIAGWIASLIVGNSHEQGAIGNIVVGILGALLGGFLVGILGGQGVTGFNIMSMMVAIFGSVVLLLLFRGFSSHHRV